MSTTLQKVAIATVGTLAAAAYLDDKYAIRADLAVGKKVSNMRKRTVRNFAESRTIVDWWYESLNRDPKKLAFIMINEDGSVEKYTFQEIEQLSNKWANFAQSKGLARGDSISLFMENRPDYVACWLGMAKIGVKTAMINTSIKEKGLSHCIKISGCKAVVYGLELEEPLAAIAESVGVPLFLGQGKGATPKLIPGAVYVDDALKSISDAAVPASVRAGLGTADMFGSIYTSGTTGFPKAAKISHAKMFSLGGGLAAVFELKPDDIVYTCLPLFHSAGGGIGAGLTVICGHTMVLRKKFSASHFWKDCGEHGVTVVQYIGELCRYLLATPPSPFDRKHKVRIAVGNGLRGEIWAEFQKRFNIPEIGEFYGATESNGALFNHCKSPESIGTVGRLGAIFMRVTGMRFVKFDVEKEEIVRDKATGFAMDCAPGEPGELLMLIRPDDPTTTFAGYTDPVATAKKIAKDVFVKGDQYFRTGDLLSRDEKGYVRFVDRIGDTFRWKGENCSTAEVAEVVSVFANGILEANVYGVLVPNNNDGRAPCAAITLTVPPSQFDFKGFLKHLQKNLPSYAVPLFLRVTPQIDVTQTFKHQKVELRNEGMDIAVVKDPLYVLRGGEYIPLVPQVYAEITKPQAKL